MTDNTYLLAVSLAERILLFLVYFPTRRIEIIIPFLQTDRKVKLNWLI